MWSVAQYSRAPWVETSFNAQATQRLIHRLLALFGYPPRRGEDLYIRYVRRRSDECEAHSRTRRTPHPPGADG